MIPVFESIKRDFNTLSEKYPKLKSLSFSKTVCTIEGEIEIIDSEGTNWQSYEIKVVIPSKYPKLLPMTFETSEKIIREKDWHVSKTGLCCLGPDVKLYQDLKGDYTIINWFDTNVMPYFANHVYRVNTNEYIGFSYAHESEGILQFYKKWWPKLSEAQIFEKLSYVSGCHKLGRNERCFCGSKKKYKKCHLTESHYSNVPVEILKKDFLQMNLGKKII